MALLTRRNQELRTLVDDARLPRRGSEAVGQSPGGRGVAILAATGGRAVGS